MNYNLNPKVHSVNRKNVQTSTAIVKASSVTRSTTFIRNSLLFPLVFFWILMLISLGSNAGNMPGKNVAISTVPLTAPAFDDITIYRLQLRIYTCNNEDAGTDDDVYVQLNSADEQFFLDKSHNDFVKGKDNKYDILSGSIKKIRDIDFLKLGLRGNDGTCVRRIQLFINNNTSPIFEKSYTGHGKWIDNSGSFTISLNEMQQYRGWRYTTEHKDLWKPPSGKLSKTAIISVVECSMGNQLNHQSTVAWGEDGWGPLNTLFGPSGIEVSYVNNKTLHFDLDLQRKMHGPNTEVDVDFDLEFSCKDGHIYTEIKNLKYEDVGHIAEIQIWIREKGSILLATAIGTELGSPESGAVVGGFISKYLSLGLNLNLDNPVIFIPCNSIEVLPDCGIVFNKS